MYGYMGGEEKWSNMLLVFLNIDVLVRGGEHVGSLFSCRRSR